MSSPEFRRIEQQLGLAGSVAEGISTTLLLHEKLTEDMVVLHTNLFRPDCICQVERLSHVVKIRDLSTKLVAQEFAKSKGNCSRS